MKKQKLYYDPNYRGYYIVKKDENGKLWKSWQAMEEELMDGSIKEPELLKAIHAIKLKFQNLSKG